MLEIFLMELFGRRYFCWKYFDMEPRSRCVSLVYFENRRAVLRIRVYACKLKVLTDIMTCKSFCDRRYVVRQRRIITHATFRCGYTSCCVQYNNSFEQTAVSHGGGHYYYYLQTFYRVFASRRSARGGYDRGCIRGVHCADAERSYNIYAHRF